MSQSTASNTASDLAFADTLWKSADALRGQVDAAECKHVVVGLLFLKYISDSFEASRDDLKKEVEKDGIKGKQLERLLENRDKYTAERTFWVPPESRWSNILMLVDSLATTGEVRWTGLVRHLDTGPRPAITCAGITPRLHAERSLRSILANAAPADHGSGHHNIVRP